MAITSLKPTGDHCYNVQLLWAFTANPFPPGLKQFILQPKNPYQFVSSGL